MTDYNLIPQRTAKELVPDDVMLSMSIKIYMVGSLAWDYADTVLDLVRQAKISDTKKQSRELQLLYERYLRFRDRCGSDSLAEEKRLGLLFEELNQNRLTKLYEDLSTEIRYTTTLDDTWRSICASVLTALTVLDAIKMYARNCDRRIDNYGVNRKHSLLQDEFVELGTVLYRFIEGKCNTKLITRQKVAQELYAEILSLETCEDK